MWLSVTWLRSPSDRRNPEQPWLIAGASLVLAASLAFDLFRYFTVFQSSEEQRIAFDTDLLSMIDLAQEDSETVILLPYVQQQAVIKYLTWGMNPHRFFSASVDEIAPEATVLLRQSDSSLLEELQRAHPDSRVSTIDDPVRNTEFIAVTIK